jgi:hypothetical protein
MVLGGAGWVGQCVCALGRVKTTETPGRCWKVRSSVMNRTWDQSMLDREPCKNDEWLSEMENRDVSAPELVDVHVLEREWLARERRVKTGMHDMLRARVEF